MSLLKSLQQMPATITIFHSSKLPVSVNLLTQLQKNAVYGGDKGPAKKSVYETMKTFLVGDKGNRFKYKVDISENLPTQEQFNFIKKTLPTNPSCKTSFKSAFPSISADHDKSSDLQNLDYELLKDQEGKPLETLVNSGVFHPPLIVDWDHKLLASDETSLKKIFQHYH